MNEHDLAAELRAEQRTILAAIWIERVICLTIILVLAAAFVALLLWGVR
jgi:hypothetical protein